jgi:hypothetical protein
MILRIIIIFGLLSLCFLCGTLCLLHETLFNNKNLRTYTERH